MLVLFDMNLKHSFFPTKMTFSLCISRFGGGRGGHYTKQQPLLLVDRFIHSVQETVKESSDVPRLSTIDKQKFIDMMRGKLDVIYREVYRKNINPLLMCVARECLSDVKEAVEQKINEMTSAKGKGLMDDLLETKWQVSTAFLEERRKAEKERMKSFPHINDVEEMCRASDHQAGMERREKLMELVCSWMEVLHYSGRIRRLQPHLRGISFSEKDGIEEDDIEEEEKEVTPRYSHPSDPEWLQIANQILVTYTDIDETDVSDWYQAKASAYVKQQYPLRLFLVINAMLSDSEHLPPLLAEWAELLQPNKNDWIALLYRLDNSYDCKYSQVVEHMLDEESFQDANMRDCLDIIYLYYKYNNPDCESILNKMKDKGMIPDIMFFALKAHMHSKAGNLDRAKEALDCAKDAFESFRSQVFQPDDKVVNYLLSYCSWPKT